MQDLKIKLGGKLISLNNVSVPIIYDYQNLSDPANRTNNYSLSIKLPATKEINEFFYTLYDLQVENKTELKYRTGQNNLPANYELTPFNKDKITPAQVYQNGISIFDGWLKLTRILTNNNEIHTYEVRLTGDNAPWAELARNLLLTELERFNQVECYNRDFVVNFPDNGNNQFERYVVQLINYGALTADMDGSAIDKRIDLENLYISYFIHAVITGGFEQIGYRLNPGSIFSKLPYSNAVLPFINGEWKTLVGNLSTENPWAQAQNNDITKVIISGLQPYSDVIIDFEEVTIGAPDLFTNQTEGNNLFTYNPDYFCGKISVTFKVNFALKNYTTPNIDYNFGIELHSSINGLIEISEIIVPPNTFGVFNCEIIAENYQVSPGEYFFIFIPAITHLPAPPADVRLEYCEFNLLGTENRKKENFKFNLKDNLPENVTFMEFLQGLIKMFNLYIETDNQLKTVSLFTYEEYFLNLERAITPDPRGELRVQEWGNKADYLREVEQKFINSELPKIIQFKYKTANDVLNNNFTQENDSVEFASYYIENSSNLVKDLGGIESPFKATINRNLINGLSEYSVPHMISVQPEDLPVNNVTGWGLRVLMYEKIEVPNFTWLLKYENFTLDESIEVHPAGYMFGNLADLRFTPGGLFNFYDEDYNLLLRAKQVQLFVKLNEKDIASKNKFRYPIKIGKEYYYLSRIQNYDPSNNQVTKVILIHLQ